ncbi:AAA family ATPase [Kordiimonas sp.]|uniref:AAA family ATPase n=1 Tax=Kordiimonas sp. TaxID=1970157 RepID=UPI003A9433E5
MRNLLFKELRILSKVEKRAIRIKFHPSRNVILGENDVGKSTLIKALYHSLGADTPQLNNSRWKRANAIYVLTFLIEDNEYTVLRDGRFFGFFNSELKLVSKHLGITGEKGVSKAINPLLNFDVELKDKDDVLKPLGPAFFFLPYYIDQDDGWSKSWSCFNGLQAISKYRKNMLEYHLGIKNQKAYAAIKKIYELDRKVEELVTERESLQLARNSYLKKKSELNIDVDPATFRSEIEELVRKFNETLETQNIQIALIKDIRNRKLQKEEEIRVLEQSIRELEADYTFAESTRVGDKIDCPTCGTEFCNSIAERFSLLDDRDYCESLVDQKRKDLRGIDMELEAQNKVYSDLFSEVKSYKSLLDQKRNDVTFQEMITSEGYKDIMKSLNEEIAGLTRKISTLTDEIDGEKSKTKVEADTKKSITETYQEKMKEGLSSLNVDVLTEDDYSSIEKVIKTNAIGSDLPRSLLAQYYSFLHTMKKHNPSTVCPLVIDSPLQQEQDKKNSEAIFNFILDNLLPSQQLVLGTISMDEAVITNRLQQDCKIIRFTEKYALLQESEYDAIEAEVRPLHKAALEV